jgi:KUP system potassium uptake protein
VFGDVGTSPIYAFREAFVLLEVSEENVAGVLSMIVCAVTLAVSIKYLALLCYVQGGW